MGEARRIALGDKVIDPVTDFHGIVTCRSEYLGGAVRIGVESVRTGDVRIAELKWFDEARLEPVTTPKPIDVTTLRSA